MNYFINKDIFIVTLILMKYFPAIYSIYFSLSIDKNLIPYRERH